MNGRADSYVIDFFVKIHNADLEAIVILAIFGCMPLILPASRKLPDITMSGNGSNFQPTAHEITGQSGSLPEPGNPMIL